MRYGKTIEIDLPYGEAVVRAKEAFKGQGFGTLTEIDVRKTLKEKLGLEMEDYIILAACNAQLAHGALDIDRDIGLLLPCNAVVRRWDGWKLVQASDPSVNVRVPERPELQPIANDASRRIDAALAALAEGRT